MALARPPMPILPRAARKGQVWPSPRSVRGPASQRVDQMIDQPSAVVGMEDGQVQALVGEPTPEYPEGQPEMMTITNAEGETGEAPEEDAILRGFRALLTVLGGGEAAYSGGGNIKVKPKKYATGGAVLVNRNHPGYTAYMAGQGGVGATVGAPATGARIAYQQEQARVAAERIAARQRLDAMREPEEQRLQRESEEYKFAAGGLATPKTAQELALEEEDRLDAMRALRLEQFGAAAGIESVNESAADRARSERERAEDRAERDADRQANLREAEAARRAAEAEEKRYRDQLAKAPRTPERRASGTMTGSEAAQRAREISARLSRGYSTGGRMMIAPKRYAEGGVAYVNSLSAAKIAAMEARERAQMAKEQLQARLEEEDARERAEAMRQKTQGRASDFGTKRFGVSPEDYPSLVDEGLMSEQAARSSLLSEGFNSDDIENTFRLTKRVGERKRSEQAKKDAEAAKPKRYGSDRLGRFKDDDLLEMVDLKQKSKDPDTGADREYPLLTERELRDILRRRPEMWTDDEISVALATMRAKKKKTEPLSLTPRDKLALGMPITPDEQAQIDKEDREGKRTP